MKKFAAGLIAVAMSVTMLAGCGVPANTVHSVDDLEGKTIGVQLGTTGDIYAEDVKDAKVEKYNKGADADRKSTRLNSSHRSQSRMPSSA